MSGYYERKIKSNVNGYGNKLGRNKRKSVINY
jgi:hypothetical protein